MSQKTPLTSEPPRQGAAAPRSGPRAPAASGHAGYNLVAMVIAILILNVMVAAAMPLWSHASRRDKEEELIFRGFQYAEAIRVFQTRFGRLPTKLDELMKVKPRSIRQLWKDPMTENGEWRLVFQAQQPDPRQRRGTPRGPGGRVLPRPQGRQTPDRRTLTTGPIIGVYSASEETAIKILFDNDQYNKWQFTVETLRGPTNLRPEAPLPRASATWFGRPFREGLQPQVSPTQGRELADPNQPQAPGQGQNPGRGLIPGRRTPNPPQRPP